jgi:hypothetical protein
MDLPLEKASLWSHNVAAKQHVEAGTKSNCADITKRLTAPKGVAQIRQGNRFLLNHPCQNDSLPQYLESLTKTRVRRQ